MKEDRSIFYTVAALILIFGLFLIIPNAAVSPGVDISQESVVTYQGVEGKSALELLRDNHTVTSDSYDFGEFVTGIDGQLADKTTFWAFYVNGAQAQVGASEYQTKSGDIIEWKLEVIN